MNRRVFLGGLGAAGALSACAAPAPAAVSRPHRRKDVKKLVVREAHDLGVSPALALAVAHAESSFNPRALSHKGARGVMQIMPATAWGEYGIAADMLWDPRTNVRIGLHFLNRLIRRYDGRTDLALSYYNGGSRVGRLPDARVIPATRRYVDRVHQLEAMYRQRLARGDV
ncbi:MAG: lytic transglycosylase domain-containing protein [Alphaproteobacteria bacterium]|nr:lytic transglycosylase domain-containing protein [Alphaproteobacteria bacterium]